MSLPQLRAGLAGEVAPSDVEVSTIETTLALMRLFTQDAVEVAGRYTQAHGRTSVGARDIQRALMYCARTFFEASDEDLQHRIEEELKKMDEEEEDEEDEEEEEEEEEEDEEDEEDEECETSVDAAASPRSRGLVRHVDAVVQTWHLWTPTDPVHVLVKRAIDRTSVT